MLLLFVLLLIARFLNAYYKLVGGFKQDLYVTCNDQDRRCVGSNEAGSSIFEDRIVDHDYGYTQIMLFRGAAGEELCLEESGSRKLQLARCVDIDHAGSSSSNQLFIFKMGLIVSKQRRNVLWWDGHGRSLDLTSDPFLGVLPYKLAWQAQWYQRTVQVHSPTIIDWQRSWDSWWAHGCDFRTAPGNDFFNLVMMEPGQCGPKCATISTCSHFAWSKDNGGGTCWFKRGPVSKVDAIALTNRDILCGIVHPEKRAK